MHKKLVPRLLFPCIVLIVLLAACSSTPPTTTGQTPTSGTTPGATATIGGAKMPTTTPVSTTAPEPPTQTNCPAAATARAAVMAPLALGSHPNIVYTVNEFQGNTPTFGTLKRHDVTTGNKTEVVKLPGSITNAQISADGQWILFVTYTSFTSGPVKLQLIRMDGKGLQTLYCANGNSIQGPQWSTDQKQVVFGGFTNGLETIYLLNMSNGNLQSELTASTNNGIVGFNFRTWLDNTRIYLTNIQPDQPPDMIYILDTRKGPNQHISDLTTVVQKTFGDFDSSFDGTHLYVDYGLCGQGGCFPPGKITVQPATGGAEATVLNSPQYDTVAVRAVTANTLLVLIRNDQVAVPNADTSHNGLWKMNADGSRLTRLTSDAAHTLSALNGNSQYPWSNVSRDGSMYALEPINYQANVSSFTLVFGSLNGGMPTTFASIADGTQLNITGWTTM